jgi:hypothetical protein
MTREQICGLAGEILEEMTTQQRRPVQPSSLAMRMLRTLVGEAVRAGASLGTTHDGPWRVGPSERRLGSYPVPLVEAGEFRMYIESHDQPYEIAALLNWCGCEEPDEPDESESLKQVG